MRTPPARPVHVAAAAAAVTLTAALAALPQATSAGAEDRRAPRSETLHLVLRNGTETVVDVAEPGVGAGDYSLKVDDLFEGDRPMGRSTQQCILVRADPEPDAGSLLHCTITLMLPEGQVTVQGSFGIEHFPPTLAVTGGTGRYTGVWGEVVETDGDGDSTTFDLRLQHPRR